MTLLLCVSTVIWNWASMHCCFWMDSGYVNDRVLTILNDFYRVLFNVLVDRELLRGLLRLQMECERAAFLRSVIDFLLFVHNLFPSHCFHPRHINQHISALPLSLLVPYLQSTISLIPRNVLRPYVSPRCLLAALPVDGGVWRRPSLLHGAGSRPVPPQRLHLHLETHLPHLQR